MKHLKMLDWYKSHLAWLGYNNGAEPHRANLSGANLRGADLPTWQKWVSSWQTDGTIAIGCETKTIAEWDAFFASEETYTTCRNTADFERIDADYQHLRRMYEIWLKYENNEETK